MDTLFTLSKPTSTSLRSTSTKTLRYHFLVTHTFSYKIFLLLISLYHPQSSHNIYFEFHLYIFIFITYFMFFYINILLYFSICLKNTLLSYTCFTGWYSLFFYMGHQHMSHIKLQFKCSRTLFSRYRTIIIFCFIFQIVLFPY